MKIAVSNSSPLILLSKINKLEILTHTYDLIYIPEEVYEETVKKGLDNGHPDALLIQNIIDDKKI